VSGPYLPTHPLARDSLANRPSPKAYATPYLLSLGLSKSKLSLVWIAGPLSGLIMQPVVGMISDRSKSKYGRRRPFMVAGTVAVFVCLLVLGWTKELVGWFVEDRELVCVCSIEFCEIRSDWLIPGM